MKDAKIDYANLAKAGKDVSKMFNRVGQNVINVNADERVRRTSGVSYKEMLLTVASGQTVTLRVKQTGDVYQVLMNGTLMALKNQDNQAKAVAEIADSLEKNEAAFQKKMARTKVDLPASTKSVAPKLAEALTAKVADLDGQIAEKRKEVEALQAELGEQVMDDAGNFRRNKSSKELPNGWKLRKQGGEVEVVSNTGAMVGNGKTVAQALYAAGFVDWYNDLVDAKDDGGALLDGVEVLDSGQIVMNADELRRALKSSRNAMIWLEDHPRLEGTFKGTAADKWYRVKMVNADRFLVTVIKQGESIQSTLGESRYLSFALDDAGEEVEVIEGDDEDGREENPDQSSLFGDAVLDATKQKYEVNHNTFSQAMQEAYDYAEKNGYTVSDDDIDRDVAMGPAKPREGKTNSYSLGLLKAGKEQKKALQVQVYGKENGVFELNCYIS